MTALHYSIYLTIKPIINSLGFRKIFRLGYFAELNNEITCVPNNH